MRPSLFVASAYLLPGVHGDCTGYTYRSYLSGLEGCVGVFVSCWSKLGDSCDYEFDIPHRSVGYEVVDGETASMTGPFDGKIHCGSEDGSVQWKNYEEATICPVDTSAPTGVPTPSPTDAPTDAPSSSPTAAVPLPPASVRAAMNDLCVTFQAGEEECLSKVDDLMASLIEEAATEEEEVEESLDFGVPTANILSTRAGGLSAGTALPIVLVSLASIFALSLSSYLRRQQDIEYNAVPDADI
mmetsp:Transcript_2505/g.5350  ORF Transcript_2505/g.5350 Transcript_2505/m.5350 type:complete len:242 (-) Transcript_2505:33-758(-)